VEAGVVAAGLSELRIAHVLTAHEHEVLRKVQADVVTRVRGRWRRARLPTNGRGRGRCCRLGSHDRTLIASDVAGEQGDHEGDLRALFRQREDALGVTLAPPKAHDDELVLDRNVELPREGASVGGAMLELTRDGGADVVLGEARRGVGEGDGNGPRGLGLGRRAPGRPGDGQGGEASGESSMKTHAR